MENTQAGDAAVQTLAPKGDVPRYEGVAFSPAGDRIAIATSEGNTILLYRRNADGRFEDTPSDRLDGAATRLDYPHDVAFAGIGDRELLAVANRSGTIGIWEKHRDDEGFPREPVFEIGGPEAALNYSDGVTFVPPRNDHLAVCNLLHGTVTFYRLASIAPVAFRQKPVFTLHHESLAQPDGIAVSACGRWLAAANHGDNSVSVYARRNRLWSGNRLRYRAQAGRGDPRRHTAISPLGGVHAALERARRDQRRRQPLQRLRQAAGRTPSRLGAGTHRLPHRRERSDVPGGQREQ